MKDIRPALRALLLADPTVSGLVGGSRIYPLVMPQGMRSPSVVYQRIAGVYPYTMDGPAGIVQSSVQFDSIAETNDAANQLANAVHDVLTGMKGEVFYGGNSPQSSVVFQGIFQTNERDLYDSELLLHRISRDFNVWFIE